MYIRRKMFFRFIYMIFHNNKANQFKQYSLEVLCRPNWDTLRTRAGPALDKSRETLRSGWSPVGNRPVKRGQIRYAENIVCMLIRSAENTVCLVYIWLVRTKLAEMFTILPDYWNKSVYQITRVLTSWQVMIIFGNLEGLISLLEWYKFFFRGFQNGIRTPETQFLIPPSNPFL